MHVIATLLICLITQNAWQAQGTSLGPVLLPIDENGFNALREKSKGRVLVLNFWATWCKPCVEEFPEFLKLQKRHSEKGLDVVFISIDDDSRARQKVTSFLRRLNVTDASYIKETDDDEKFINAMNPRWSGGVPATFIYNRKGELVTMKVEELEKSELERLVLPLLQK
ncbi:MAG: TlpA family protein disulfide reductase [Phycisphaeraceae bacterium]|nr:TlpA family protein disulfide reductase [Bacteroidota bacterium]MCW5768113.1 TlpA family protein disulfide reductase [Phycisphaeraceae bacterium]